MCSVYATWVTYITARALLSIQDFLRAVRRRHRFVVGEELVEFFKSVFGSLFVFDFAIAELSNFFQQFLPVRGHCAECVL